MISAADKLNRHSVRPGSPEWKAMWAVVLAGELREYGLDMKTKPCPLCTPVGCWKYLGTWHRTHASVTSEYRLKTPETYAFVHVFRHERHPRTGNRMVRVVPASLDWEPSREREAASNVQRP